MPAFVSALNRVDLPTFGRPTMPHLTLTSCLSVGGSRFGPRVKFVHRPLCVTGLEPRPYGQRATDCTVDQRLLLAARRLQHVVDHLPLGPLLIARVADAQPQAPEAAAAHAFADVTQAVMTRGSPAELELDDAGLQVELVVRDEDLVDADAVELRDGRHADAAQVHERLRQEKAHVASGLRRSGDVALELALAAKRDAHRFGECFDEPCARVVTRRSVRASRIAETDYETKRRGHARSSFDKKARPEPPGGPSSEADDYFLSSFLPPLSAALSPPLSPPLSAALSPGLAASAGAAAAVAPGTASS